MRLIPLLAACLLLGGLSLRASRAPVIIKLERTVFEPPATTAAPPNPVLIHSRRAIPLRHAVRIPVISSPSWIPGFNVSIVLRKLMRPSRTITLA